MPLPGPRSSQSPSGRSSPGGVSDAAQRAHHASRGLDDLLYERVRLSPAEEQRQGALIHADLMRHVRSLPGRVGPVEAVARPLLGCTRRPLHYTFTVLDDDTINAFAHAGGYVYIHRGLLDRLHSDAELQGVIGHEMGHVDLGHVARSATYATRADEVAGEFAARITLAAYRLVAVGYSKDQEFEADRWGYLAMRRCGRSHDDGCAAMRRLLQMSPEAPRQQPRPGAPRDQVAEQLSEHFRTHPPTAERLRRLEAMD